ncbi:unnamed protein product [Kuraishia capsulata CBS 1993]|uniref:Palmitoyl-protein thioesterase 1 n=1 Tax=Kuraishia capsulata CBS 1993 TaxID=1382522 RepID=W6MGX2_9ASCO|nr:uncharacterized protein KUCA_T00001419001 [Kuraishia capsulata CBS 1993]CDK25449.1 unnamed protein product [Kuraishia capsulata CBS 1993]
MLILPKIIQALEWLPQIPGFEQGETEHALAHSSLPLVFWHGMGDSYNSSAMRRVEEIAREVDPDVFIHSVYIEADDSKDQEASLVGNLTSDILLVCDQLHSLPEIADGFNAIGFSQGGLFLRSVMEMCGHDLRMKTLITFGSPHNGVKDLPPCKPGDFVCKSKNHLLRSQIWRESVQNSIIPAQYFRDPYQWEEYLAHSKFIVNVNNDVVASQNTSYAKNLERLEKFVMVMFEKDDMVDPKESSWFFDVDRETGKLLSFEATESYQDNRIGLQTLHQQGKLVFESIDDVHMAIGKDVFKQILIENLL